MKAALTSLLVSALLLLGSAARAESAASLVVIVASEPGGLVAEQLKRDLTGLGLDVLLLAETPENASGRAGLERAARGFGATAAVRLGPPGSASEIWIAGGSSRAGVVRTLDSPGADTQQPAELTLAIVELLRAGFVELHSRAPTPALGEQKRTEAAPPATASPPKPASTQARFSLSAGPAVDFGLRGVGASFHAMSAAWLRLSSCFGLRSFASLPVTPQAGEVAEGRIEVRTALLGVGATCGFGGPAALLIPRVGLGLTAARVETRGTAYLGLQSNSAEAWFGGGYAQVGAALSLTAGLRLNLDLTGVLLATPAVILANRREVGRWGSPGGLFAVSLEALAR